MCEWRQLRKESVKIWIFIAKKVSHVQGIATLSRIRWSNQSKKEKSVLNHKERYHKHKKSAMSAPINGALVRKKNECTMTRALSRWCLPPGWVMDLAVVWDNIQNHVFGKEMHTPHKWGPCVVRGPMDGRFVVWWVIDNILWTDYWLSIAGAGSGLTGVGAGDEQARKVVAGEASRCGEDK
jgi:hypothetical protein